MIDRLLVTMQELGLLMSDREIDALSEAQSLLHDRDIADVLWLASKIGGAYEVAEPEPTLEPTTQIPIIENELLLSAPPPPPLFVPLNMPQAAGNRNAQTKEVPEGGLPIQVQAAPALPDTRGISRSLRPLRRKVPSLTRLELDEIATVNRIAEHDLWLPILKRSPERWFELEIVIEASEFSFIWQDTLDEFQHLLRTQGAFRDVRIWHVRDNDGQPQLIVKRQHSQGIDVNLPSRSPKELIDISGRRLILFISDCRSRIWKQGQIHEWLSLWSKHSPTAIVQLLPERLWGESELDVGFGVQVSSLTAGAFNSKLQVREMPVRTNISAVDALTLPVVTLTAPALKQWALVVAAAGRQRVPARLFDLSWVKDPNRDREAAVISPKSPEARVELFMATASVMAQQLVGMMAAVPVEMSVVHLIQQELLSDVTPVHIAEVFTSELLEEERDRPKEKSLPTRYNFVEGVRELLNLRTRLDETLGVIEALSRRIARTLGLDIKSFTALLSPKSDWSQEAKDAILPFAQITTEVLHRLGGEYRELAELVERDASGRSDWIKPVKPEMETELDIEFPALEVLEFTTAQLVESSDEAVSEADSSWLPPLQTEEYTVAIIAFDSTVSTPTAVELELFQFKVGSLVKNFWRRWSAKKTNGQAYRYIERINETVVIEMVAISGGEFMMGSPAEELDRYDFESPQHLVTVRDFYMGRYPVTQTQWRVVANSMPQVNRFLKSDPSNFKGENRPVEQVSWEEAIEFCNRLTAYTKRQYRLPTEAEWEYACRAGTTTPFHFGETISPELANYDSSVAYADGATGKHRGETTPVDCFKIANAWGLCDMHGNVLEWCQDHWHNNYEGAPDDGSAWLITDSPDASRLLRGGSWNYYPRCCRSTYRYDYKPDVRLNPLGFRVSCSAPETLPLSLEE